MASDGENATTAPVFQVDQIQIPQAPERPSYLARCAVQPNDEEAKRQEFEKNLHKLRQYLAGLEQVRNGANTGISEEGQIEFIKQQLAAAQGSQQVYQMECDRINDAYQQMTTRHTAMQERLNRLLQELEIAREEVRVSGEGLQPPGPATGPPQPTNTSGNAAGQSAAKQAAAAAAGRSIPTFPSAPPVSGYHTTPPTGYHTTPPAAGFPSAPPAQPGSDLWDCRQRCTVPPRPESDRMAYPPRG